jgi:hypothetical protein
LWANNDLDLAPQEVEIEEAVGEMLPLRYAVALATSNDILSDNPLVLLAVALQNAALNLEKI